MLSLLYRVSRGRDAWRICARSIGLSNPTNQRINQPTNERTNERASTCKRAQRSSERANERASTRERTRQGERRLSSFPSLSLGLGGYGTELENQYPSTDKYRPRLATARAPPRKSRSLFRERTEPSPLFSTPRFLSTSPSFSLLANPFLFPSSAKISSSLRFASFRFPFLHVSSLLRSSLLLSFRFIHFSVVRRHAGSGSIRFPFDRRIPQHRSSFAPPLSSSPPALLLPLDLPIFFLRLESSFFLRDDKYATISFPPRLFLSFPYIFFDETMNHGHRSSSLREKQRFRDQKTKIDSSIFV